MKINDSRIKQIRDQVEKARHAGPGRPIFPKDMKENVIALLRSGASVIDLAQMTGLGISTLNRWAAEPAVFHKVTKEESLKATTAEYFSFKLTLPNGISVESSSEVLLKKIIELASS